MPTNLEAPFSVTEANNLFKTDFKEYADDAFNTDMYLWSEMESVPMTGEGTEFPVPFGYSGGGSFGSPGEANTATYGKVQLVDKAIFQRAKVQNRAIELSMSSKGAFVKAMEEVISKAVENMGWLKSFTLFGDGTGAAGVINTGGVTDNGGGSFTVVVGASASAWKEANFEEKAFYNIGDGQTDLFECTAVDPSTREVTFQRQAVGSYTPVDADIIYINKGDEYGAPLGLAGIFDAEVNGVDALYGITCVRRWVTTIDDTAGPISHARINNLMASIERKVGKKRMPNIACTSYEQMAKLNNISESDKRYTQINVKPKGAKYSKTVGFDGIQVLTSRGAITVLADKFCEPDRMYFLNTDQMKRYTVTDGWFTKDGTTFLRELDSDSMEARLIFRGQYYIAPTYQAMLDELTV